MICLLLSLISDAGACSRYQPATVIVPTNGSEVSPQATFLVFFSPMEWTPNNRFIQVFARSGTEVPIDVRWVGDVAEIHPLSSLSVGDSYQIVQWPTNRELRPGREAVIASSRVHVVDRPGEPMPAPVLSGAPRRWPPSSGGLCGPFHGGVSFPVSGSSPNPVYGVWNLRGSVEQSGPDWWALGDAKGFALGGGDLFEPGPPYGTVWVRELGADGRWSAPLEVQTPPVGVTPDLPP